MHVVGQALMDACAVQARIGSYEDVAHALVAVLQTAAREAALAGVAELFSPVHLAQRDACLTGRGIWVNHAVTRSLMPIVSLHICGASSLLDVLCRGVTTKGLDDDNICSECRAEVSELPGVDLAGVDA